MKTLTGVIRALPDNAPQPNGLFMPLEFSVKHAQFIAEVIGYRLVWWRGNFYAVSK